MLPLHQLLLLQYHCLHWPFLKKFIYVCLTVLGPCRMGFSLVVLGGSYSLVVVPGLLIPGASLVKEHVI